MRYLVCGGRDYGEIPGEEEYLFEYLDNLTPRPTLIIHGAAKGADSLAEKWAVANGIPTEPYPANWQKYGRAAGEVRNRLMLKKGKPDKVIAFPGGSGTGMMIRLATVDNVPVEKVALPKKVSPKMRQLVKKGMPMPFG
jgi:hypothetical protein